ncbi:MAG: TM0106 family RecB-like putative nuclease [Dehalococcoidia bacterium]|nr:TM0106 family RecB-like putative nuclease [Dehalococcoidia bacterium]
MTPPRQETVDKILRRHLAPGDKEFISASDVARCVSSPFALYCDKFAPEDERDPVSPLLEMLRERGSVHEREVIDGDIVTHTYETLEDGFRLTVEMMAAGVPTILQGPLISNPVGLRGIPDQILKVHNSKSVFGNYGYRVVEVKSNFKLTMAHKIQGAFYNHLLGLIQNLTPKEFGMINGREEETVETFDDWQTRLAKHMERTREVVSRRYKPRPVFGRTPAPWRSYGDKLAGLTKLWQIGRVKEGALIKAGFSTIEDLALASPSDLSSVPGIWPHLANRIVVQANAILKGVPIPRSPVRLPHVAVEVFLDMENTNEGLDALAGTRDGFVNYLTGVMVRSKSDERYIGFFAESPEEEEKCWREFCKLIADAGSVAVYHWSASAEPVYIRKMIEKYKTPPAIREKLVDNLVDLHRTTTDAFAFPTPSYGLKEIAGHLGFEWRSPHLDGLLAMVAYKNYVSSGSTDVSIRTELLSYNEDDCRALMAVKDWLVANSL